MGNTKMIKWHRVHALLYRHLYEIKASIDRKFDIFLFPTIDLLVLGLLTSYMNKLNFQNGIAATLIGGIILWSLVYNIQRDISFFVLDDAWSRSLYNLFSTPLRLSEMIIATLILSIIKALFTISFMLFLAFELFHFNLLQYGWIIAFYILNLFIFGWAFGFFTVSLIFRFGTKVQALAWSLILLIYPISGVFYPLDTLPLFLEKVAHFIPVSYIFEGLRQIILHGTLPDASNMGIIMVLSVAYLAAGILIFIGGFKNAKKRGWFINPT